MFQYSLNSYDHWTMYILLSPLKKKKIYIYIYVRKTKAERGLSTCSDFRLPGLNRVCYSSFENLSSSLELL